MIRYVLFMFVFAVAPGFAQICGDGVLNFGERCDDGNVAAGDCCSPFCNFELAGTVCRASTTACDAAEVCSGDDGSCPADTGVLGDTDGDGWCDPIDGCPTVGDPAQTDRDGDDVGDACDPCTNVFPGVIESAKLRLRKLDFPAGSQRIKLHGTFVVPTDPSIDPVERGLRYLITDGVGRTMGDVMIPAGLYDPATRQGWIPAATGWTYVDPLGLAGGVKKLLLRRASTLDGEFRLVVFGQGAPYTTHSADPVVVTVVLDPPTAIDGQCAEAVFERGHCTYRNLGGKLVCH